MKAKTPRKKLLLNDFHVFSVHGNNTEKNGGFNEQENGGGSQRWSKNMCQVIRRCGINNNLDVDDIENVWILMYFGRRNARAHSANGKA